MSQILKLQSIAPVENREWRAKISYVAQDTPIMLGNILSNLTYGVEEYSFDQVEKAIEDVNLTEFINSLPQKYETEVGDRGITLSGGQKQRATIKNADKIIILNQGEIIGSGSHIQLLQSNDLYKKLVKQQVV